jgi:hypothetical protein
MFGAISVIFAKLFLPTARCCIWSERYPYLTVVLSPTSIR